MRGEDAQDGEGLRVPAPEHLAAQDDQARTRAICELWVRPKMFASGPHEGDAVIVGGSRPRQAIRMQRGWHRSISADRNTIIEGQSACDQINTASVTRADAYVHIPEEGLRNNPPARLPKDSDPSTLERLCPFLDPSCPGAACEVVSKGVEAMRATPARTLARANRKGKSGATTQSDLELLGRHRRIAVCWDALEPLTGKRPRIGSTRGTVRGGKGWQ